MTLSRSRHPLAHLDGMIVPGSCCDTEIRLRSFSPGVGNISYAHDPWCDHTDPATQARAVLALRDELKRRGLQVVVVSDVATGRSFLLMGGADS